MNKEGQSVNGSSVNLKVNIQSEGWNRGQRLLTIISSFADENRHAVDGED